MKTKSFGSSLGAFALLLFAAVMAGFATNSQAATITADFNGDGRDDTATVNDVSGAISIAHGGGGVSNFWVPRNWLSMSACECNGIAGQELVVAYNDGEVSIIDDRVKDTRSYYADPVGLGRAMFFSNLNGAAGMEIALVYNNGNVDVIDDRARTLRYYLTQSIGRGRVVSIAELNGAAGNEIAMIFNDGFVYVIDHRIGETRWYIVEAVGGVPRYQRIGNFDGLPGNEIMFSHLDGRTSEGYSDVVDDRSRKTRYYFYSTNGKAPVYANVDGVEGIEAIFANDWGKDVIVDRTRSVISR